MDGYNEGAGGEVLRGSVSSLSDRGYGKGERGVEVVGCGRIVSRTLGKKMVYARYYMPERTEADYGDCPTAGISRRRNGNHLTGEMHRVHGL